MKRKIKKLFSNWRIILLLVFLIFGAVAIHPNPWNNGATIRNVISNSSAFAAGITSPKPATRPMSREVILAVNNAPVDDIEDYFQKIESLRANSTVHLRTNRGEYTLRIGEEKELGIVVYEAPTTNIRQGLDLQGGTRVLLKPEKKLDMGDIGMLIDNMKQRLNVYGLSDLIIREANDLPPPLGSGNQYIVVEIAGATKEEVQNLLAKQGKFEAKIGNETVFTGGNDIRSVCRTADCAGIDPQYGCGQNGNTWICRFRFSITLSKEAAESQAEATKDLGVITDENNNKYLEKQLRLFLDDKEVDQLNIGSDLKGRAVTDIQISGSGNGATQQQAALNSLQNMKRLQTLLITGSLPVKIDIVKMDTVSPILGEEFVRNAIFIGALAIIAVAAVIFLRYRKIKISLSMFLTMLSEVLILLGIAALIGWNLDLAAIAGIIIVVGTSVDHLIVITDETLRGESQIYDWKKRLKRALFIIMAAYFTTVVAMFPLVFAGAGLLKGFAITTIIGVSIGVLITRPAYGAVIEVLMKE
ncbi:hypothetical protein GF323_06650 [Candidatus Woesearchaeota archaeon]|nr:hypothetical protein [Candidatus Woesearchaeota archaeon]